MQLIVLTGKRCLNSSNVTLHFGFRIITTLKGNKTETALEQLTWLTKTKGILTACVSRWKTGCGPAGRRRWEEDDTIRRRCFYFHSWNIQHIPTTNRFMFWTLSKPVKDELMWSFNLGLASPMLSNQGRTWNLLYHLWLATFLLSFRQLLMRK